MSELRNRRGDILIVFVGWLKGVPEAIRTALPDKARPCLPIYTTEATI